MVECPKAPLQIQFVDILVEARFDVDFANAIVAELASTPVWEERDSILGCIIREIHDGSWFSIEGLAGIVDTGGCPGGFTSWGWSLHLGCKKGAVSRKG